MAAASESAPLAAPIVSLLLDNGALLETANQQGQTPLMRACENGNAAAVRVLLQRGANPMAAHSLSKWQALHFAAVHGQAAAVTVLLDSMGPDAASAAANVQLGPEELCRTALHLACTSGSAETVRELLKFGAHPNVVDADGNTPLHLCCDAAAPAAAAAAREARMPIVRLLLDAGASLEARNAMGNTALQLAYCYQKELRDVVALLEAAARQRSAPSESAAAGDSEDAEVEASARDASAFLELPDIEHAIRRGDCAVLRCELGKYDSHNHRPPGLLLPSGSAVAVAPQSWLHFACDVSQLGVVQLLLQYAHFFPVDACEQGESAHRLRWRHCRVGLTAADASRSRRQFAAACSGRRSQPRVARHCGAAAGPRCQCRVTWAPRHDPADGGMRGRQCCHRAATAALRCQS